jgi:asparagine synthase (glutamine-hydrolysing)
MCGIAGLISRAPLSGPQSDQVDLVNSLLAHRGPDGTGSYTHRQVKLAMRRLSIIDLQTGWQPLYNEDRSLVLIANGEIYNHVELRRRLQARGHVFASGSDCETILHLYEEYGSRFVEHLRGMYAFALWDNRSRRLILGRDRMGEKPLYLVTAGNSLFFASELRALVRAGVVPFNLDPQAVNLYYHYGYVPEPACMVAGVRKLPAAHLLTVDLDSWTFHEHCYWRMEDAPALEGNPADLIREQLEESAQLITRADVPVGIALSGGLDASAIAALATKARSRDIQAFTVGYSGTPWQDERKNAKAFAEYLKIPFHSVELSPGDCVEQYSAVNLHRDDPIADGAGIAVAAVSQLARQHSVPVLMFGHGGDELFWGYRWVRAALRATRRREALLSGVRGFKDYLRFSPPPFSVTLGFRWAMSGAGILSEWRQFQADRRASSGRVVFYESEYVFLNVARALAGGFFAPGFREQIGHPDLTMGFTAQRSDSTPESTLIRLICETYLMENGIAQGDRLSMASSVEARLPLVDYRLVETVIGLHKTYPLAADARPKQWLREAVSGLVPNFVLNRRKVGFSPPWRQWGYAIAAAHGGQLIDGYLVQNGIIRPEVAKRQREDLFPSLSGPRPLASLSLGLENWCRQMSAGPARHRFESVAAAAAPRASLEILGEAAASIAGPMGGAISQPPDADFAIGQRAVSGSVWLIGASGVAKVLGFLCQLALAWFLTKEDYGVYAIAISLSVFLSILRDGGLPMVLEQKGRQFDRFAGSVFWMMLAANAGTAVAIALIAQPAAQFYQIPELARIMTLFAITVPLSVLPSVLSVRLALGMKFRELALIGTASAIVRSVLLLLFASHGYGASSLLLPLLITNLTDSLAFWLVTRYSPWTLPPRFRMWPELFRSGRWVLLGTFAIGFGNSGAYFILGRFLPSDLVGTYFFAYQIVVQLGTLLSDNVYQVLAASFARMGQDLARIRAAVPRAISVVVLVGAVASLSIAAIYEPLERILWHGKWSASTHAVYILAALWPAAAGISVLRALQMATARFRQWGTVTLISSLASVCGTVIGAYLGRSAVAAAMGFGLGALFGAALNARLALPAIGIRTMDIALSIMRPWLTLVFAALCATLAGNLCHDAWLALTVSAGCFLALSFLGLSLFARHSLNEVAMSLRRTFVARFDRRRYVPVE